MSSEEFVKESVQNKTGKNVGKRSICFNGKRKDKVHWPICRVLQEAVREIFGERLLKIEKRLTAKT